MKDKNYGFFSFDGPFYGMMEKIVDVMMLSIYWIVGCIPIITVGASFAALYYASSQSIRKDRKTITQSFWGAFRQNFAQGVKLWLIVAGAGFLLLLNIGILDEKMSNVAGIGFMVLYAVCFAIVLVAACYAFPALSRFDEPVGWIVKLALYLTFRHLLTSILLLALFAAAYFAVFFVPVSIIIVPGVVSFVSTFLIEPILAKHTPE